MAESNTVSLKYIEETSPTVYPVDSDLWQHIPYLSCSLAHVPQVVVSNEIGDGTEQIQDLICVGSVNSGEIGFELTPYTYNDLFSAAFQGNYVGTPPQQQVNVRTTDPRTFAFEIGYEGWDTPHYIYFTGCRIATHTLNFVYGEIITGSFGVVAQESMESVTSIVGTGTPIPVTFPREPMDVSCSQGQLLINGTGQFGTVKNLNITLNNDLRPLEGIGASGAQGFNAGRVQVTGTMTVYFEEILWYQRLLAGEEFEVQMGCNEGDASAGTLSMTWILPRCKLTEGSPVVSGADTDVMLTLNFTALYNYAEDESAMRLYMTENV